MYVNGKMIPLETTSGIKENDEGGGFKYDIVNIL
jgi:hypothetical protein